MHIDHTEVLRVWMQNTQHSFQLYSDGLEIKSIIDYLTTLGVSLFAPISLNVNWNNTQN